MAGGFFRTLGHSQEKVVWNSNPCEHVSDLVTNVETGKARRSNEIKMYEMMMCVTKALNAFEEVALSCNLEPTCPGHTGRCRSCRCGCNRTNAENANQ